MTAPWRPSRAQLEQARRLTVPDVCGPGLAVLFCGINPGLYTGAVGHHFARPGNRFWPALHRSGFTERQLSPFEELLLLDRGLGVTNLVARTTATAAELSPAELRSGAARLAAKVAALRPGWVAVLGLGAYRTAFDDPGRGVGEVPQGIGGSRLWVLPNPSGLNAHHQLPDLAAEFGRLRRAVAASS